jgi:hypothetical protein
MKSVSILLDGGFVTKKLYHNIDSDIMITLILNYLSNLNRI